MAATELPVFIFQPEAFTALNNGGLDEYDARFVIAPFPRFVLRAQHAAQITVLEGNIPCHLRELEISDEGNGLFRVLERLAEGRTKNELLVNVDEAVVKWSASWPKGQRIEVPGQSWHHVGKPMLDAPGTARMVIGLLLVLNHRDVVLVDGAQPTRQQRRAAERNGEPVQIERYVRIPGDIIRHVRAVARGKMAVRRAAHLVRAHVRRLGDGRITHVRSHQRGIGRIGAAPIYDATRVGGAA